MKSTFKDFAMFMFHVGVKYMSPFKSPFQYGTKLILCWICSHMYKNIVSNS